MSTLTAIFENGVFRPLGTVRLPERTSVQVSLPDIPAQAALDTTERAQLLADVRALHGALTLPPAGSDKELLTIARMEKYAPL